MVSIVVDDDVTFTAGLGAVETPYGSLTDLPTMLARLTTRFDRAGEGTIVFSDDIRRRLALPADPPADEDEAIAHPWLTPARERGWSVSALTPWMTFHRKGNATVHIGVKPWLDDDSFEIADTDPATTAYRMEWIAARLGVAYRAKPGVVGTAAVKRWTSGRTPMWKPQNWAHVRPVAMDMAWEQRYIWTSPTADALAEGMSYLHGWDVRQQFLAAASLAELAREPLRNTGVREFDGSPGYWRIVVPPWNLCGFLPHPAGNHDPGDLIWVTTPTMTLLHELADRGLVPEPVVLDSWTAAHGSRLLRRWAETIRDSIRAAKMERDPADAFILSRAMKHCYTHAIDMWGGTTSTIRRPDWRHTIHGLARCQLFRKILKEYESHANPPLRIWHDTVYYPGTSPDHEKSRPKSFEPSQFMGRMRYEKTVEL